MVMPSTVTDEVCNREKTESNLQVRTVRPVLNYTEYDQYIDHIHGNMNIREMNCQRKEDSLKEKKKKGLKESCRSVDLSLEMADEY